MVAFEKGKFARYVYFVGSKNLLYNSIIELLYT